MNTQASQPSTSATGSPLALRRVRWRRAVTFVIGFALLAAAVTVVVRSGGDVARALAASRSAPWWCVLALVCLPLVNIASVACGFWTLTQRHGRVTLREMLALITSGWLLNNLPLRPGLVGRVAYHAAVNSISVRACLVVLLQVIACAGVALAAMLGVLRLGVSMNIGAVGMTALALMPLAVLGGAAVSLRHASSSDAWRFVFCTGCRYVDILAWAARYWLVFRIVGEPITMSKAGAIAAVSEAAMLLPVQIGVREWVVGLTSAWMGGQVTSGLMGDLLNRGVEVVLGLPLGLFASAWLFKRVSNVTRANAARANQPRPTPVEQSGNTMNGLSDR